MSAVVKVANTLVIFRKRLLEARERRGITQAELSVKSGLRGSAISNLEIGNRKPAPDQLVKLADALGVSTDFLLGREDAEPR